MKIRNTLLTLLCAGSALLVGCKKDFASESTAPLFVSDMSSLSFGQEGESKSITITAASEAWRIDEASLADWLRVERDGNKIVVTTQPYTGVEPRSSQIVVHIGSGQRSFLVTQFGSAATLALAEGGTELTFKKDAEERSLQLITNSKDWTVRYLADAPWLSWEKADDGNSLVLRVNEFLRTDENATSNRKATLFVSNGSRHLRLDVLQRGWAQFGEPYFSWGATRELIQAEEEKRGHERQKDFEINQFYPKGEDVHKRFMVFSTDGEQTEYALYHFDDNNLAKFRNKVYLTAKAKTTFDQSDIDAWAEFNKFLPARPIKFERWRQPQEQYTRYYKEDETTSYLYKIFNHEKAIVVGMPHTSAYMEYTEESNELLAEIGVRSRQLEMKVFPVRNLLRLHDISYKLDEVIAYEATKGMEPDYDSPLSIKSVYPGVPYATLLFKQKQRNTADGQLVNVLYRFNYPGATEYDDNQQPTVKSDLLSHDPNLAGSVGTRMDVYQGQTIAYQRRLTASYEWGYSVIKAVLDAARSKCFDFVRGDDSGFTTFVRGKSELVDFSPLGDDKFTMTFYRSAELVKIVDQNQ